MLTVGSIIGVIKMDSANWVSWEHWTFSPRIQQEEAIENTRREARRALEESYKQRKTEFYSVFLCLYIFSFKIWHL